MAELPRPFNGRRFESGIGSLDAYDQTVTPIVELLKNMPAQSAPASVQDPVAARFIAPKVPTLQQEYEDRRDTYRGILGDPAEQRNMRRKRRCCLILPTRRWRSVRPAHVRACLLPSV